MRNVELVLLELASEDSAGLDVAQSIRPRHVQELLHRVFRDLYCSQSAFHEGERRLYCTIE